MYYHKGMLKLVDMAFILFAKNKERKDYGVLTYSSKLWTIRQVAANLSFYKTDKGKGFLAKTSFLNFS